MKQKCPIFSTIDETRKKCKIKDCNGLACYWWLTDLAQDTGITVAV